MGAGSSHRSMYASARGAGLGPSASGRPVATSRSASMSAPRGLLVVLACVRVNAGEPLGTS